MSNRETQSAWPYHNGAKHADGHLMSPFHPYGPMGNPLLFKMYSELEPIALSLDSAPPAMSALDEDGNSLPPTIPEQLSSRLSAMDKRCLER